MTTRLFLQFNISINVGNKLQKIISFAHPDLINIIKGGPVHLFIDCTFKCVPKGFSQCLVIMIYDYASSLYIPVFLYFAAIEVGRSLFHGTLFE